MAVLCAGSRKRPLQWSRGAQACPLHEMRGNVCLLHKAAMHKLPAQCLPVAGVCCCRMSGDAVPMQQGCLPGRRPHQGQHPAPAAQKPQRQSTSSMGP